VVYKGRKEGMNKYKERLPGSTTDASHSGGCLRGADVFYGLSVANVLSPEMVKSMAKDPIIFAMANPDPEIKPELATRGAQGCHHCDGAFGLCQSGQ
jgi:malic enzyme